MQVIGCVVGKMSAIKEYADCFAKPAASAFLVQNHENLGFKGTSYADTNGK